MKPEEGLKSVVEFAMRSFAVAIPEIDAGRARLWLKTTTTNGELNRRRREWREKVDAFIRDLPFSETVVEMQQVSARQSVETIAMAFDRLFAIERLLRKPLLPPRRGENATEFFRHWLIDQWGARFDHRESGT